MWQDVEGLAGGEASGMTSVTFPIPFLFHTHNQCVFISISQAECLWMFNMSVYLQFLSVLRACFAKPQVQAVVFSPPC